MPNYFQIRPVVFENIFYPLATRFFLKNHKNLNKYSKVKSHTKTICAKLFSNQAGSFKKKFFLLS